MQLFRPEPVARRRNSGLIWFMCWVAVTGIGLYLHPSANGHGTHEQLGLAPCPSVILFDRPCPGCGLTTSWTALLHGDLAFSFHAHPLGPFLYLAFTLSAILALVAWTRKEVLNTDGPMFNRAMAAGLVIFVGFGAIRMATHPHFAAPSERLLTRVSQEIQRGP